jgi:hypothetical protein
VTLQVDRLALVLVAGLVLVNVPFFLVLERARSKLVAALVLELASLPSPAFVAWWCQQSVLEAEI